MDQATREDLETIKHAILKELGEVEAIYLFGSVAKGTENKASDYDILIFVNAMPEHYIDTIVNIRGTVSKKIKRPLEAFIINVNNVKYPSPFIYEVYHGHKLLYGKNVIERFKDLIKNMRPLYIKGVKVGYYV
jgi:predicted nucleotidyltransferase